MTLKTLGMGIVKSVLTKPNSKQYKKTMSSLKDLKDKLDKIGKERKIRIQKQNEEVTKRTGKPFKQKEE